MKLLHSVLLAVVSLVAPSSLLGAEITAKVRDVSGDTVTVEIDGGAQPAVGDSAEIFFTLARSDFTKGGRKRPTNPTSTPERSPAKTKRKP